MPACSLSRQIHSKYITSTTKEWGNEKEIIPIVFFIVDKDGKLWGSYEAGRVCVVATGDLGWKSDLDALAAILRGQPSQVPVESVVAKYLINEHQED